MGLFSIFWVRGWRRPFGRLAGPEFTAARPGRPRRGSHRSGHIVIARSPCDEAIQFLLFRGTKDCLAGARNDVVGSRCLKLESARVVGWIASSQGLLAMTGGELCFIHCIPRKPIRARASSSRYATPPSTTALNTRRISAWVSFTLGERHGLCKERPGRWCQMGRTSAHHPISPARQHRTTCPSGRVSSEGPGA